MTEQVTRCQRCGAACKVEPHPGSRARMLRRTAGKGYCVNCAVHDFLRNTYPANLLLAQSGPRGLLLPHVQDGFARIMRAAGADAEPNEIDWQAVVDNWDLPFATKVKRTGENPVDQAELDETAYRGPTVQDDADQLRRGQRARARPG